MITSFFPPKLSKTGKRMAEEQLVVPNKTKKKTDELVVTVTPPSESSKSFTPQTPRLLSEEAVVLVSYLHVGEWRDALERYFATSKFSSLAKFVASEWSSRTVYPPPQLVFSALNLTPRHEVKVVIVGQDPYHQPGQGHGLSFSVPHGVTVPPSLRNIYKELLNDAAVPDFAAVPKHGNLERWARQGVLLLNNVLTVRRGEADSHKKKGWEEFTDWVIEAVVRRDAFDQGRRGMGVVFLLWGKPASIKAQTVLAKFNNNRCARHAVITCSHPSPLGATKTSSPFMGSRCFSRANDELVKRGWEPIDWRVDEALE